MIKINLVPPEYIAKLNRRAIIAKATAAGVIVAAVLTLSSIWHLTERTTSELKMRRLQSELQSLQADVAKTKAIEAEIAEVNRYLASINSITQGRLVYPHFMLDIISDMPGTIWIGGLSTTLSGATMNVSIPVNSRSAYDLAYWINSLEKDTEKYPSITVGAISVTYNGTGKVFTTPLTATYRTR